MTLSLKPAALYALVALLFCALAWNCAHAETCRASWYGRESGKITANGEHFKPDGMTAAHRSLAFGTMIGVRLGARKIKVRINDRGPARWTGRCLDLALGAARALGYEKRGEAIVTCELQPH